MAKVAETGTDVDPLFCYNNYKTINHCTRLPTLYLFAVRFIDADLPGLPVLPNKPKEFKRATANNMPVNVSFLSFENVP